MSIVGVCFLLLGPLWMAFTQALVFRIPSAQKIPRVPLSVALSLMVVTIQVALVSLFEGPRFYRSATPLFFSLTIGVCCSHFYFHVFNMSESSRRIRILTRLCRGDKLRLDTVSYSPTVIYEQRLRRLLEWGQVAGSTSRLYPKASILALAATVIKGLERLLFPERIALTNRPEDPEAE